MAYAKPGNLILLWITQASRKAPATQPRTAAPNMNASDPSTAHTVIPLTALKANAHIQDR